MFNKISYILIAIFISIQFQNDKAQFSFFTASQK